MAKHDSSLDNIFIALGDPTRRAILERLAKGPATVTDLGAPFQMTMPSLMGHLKKLEAAGLITSEKDGRVRTCALAPEAFMPVQDWLADQKAIWEARLDRLDAFVAQLAKERSE